MTPRNYDKQTLAYHREYRGDVWHTCASFIAAWVFLIALAVLFGATA